MKNLDNDSINKFENPLNVEELQNFIINTRHRYLTTHRKLCFAIIARIYRRVLQGYRFGAIKVSDNQLIVDGNHRFVAYQLANIEFETLEATHSFCDQPNTFNEIEIDCVEDWDANHPYNKRYCDDAFLEKENTDI